MKVAKENLQPVQIHDLGAKRKQKPDKPSYQDSAEKNNVGNAAASGDSVAGLVYLFKQQLVHGDLRTMIAPPKADSRDENAVSDASDPKAEKHFASAFSQIVSRMQDGSIDHATEASADLTMFPAQGDSAVATTTKSLVEVGSADTDQKETDLPASPPASSRDDRIVAANSSFSLVPQVIVEKTLPASLVLAEQSGLLKPHGKTAAAEMSVVGRDNVETTSVVNADSKPQNHRVNPLVPSGDGKTFDAEPDTDADNGKQFQEENAPGGKQVQFGPLISSVQPSVGQVHTTSISRQINTMVTEGLAQAEFTDRSANAAKTLSVRLQPEGLGQLDITLKSKDGKLKIHLLAEREDTLIAIRADSDLLKAAIAKGEQGYEHVELSFAVSSRKSGDTEGSQQGPASGAASGDNHAYSGGRNDGEENTKGSPQTGNQRTQAFSAAPSELDKTERRDRASVGGSMYI